MQLFFKISRISLSTVARTLVSHLMGWHCSHLGKGDFGVSSGVIPARGGHRKRGKSPCPKSHPTLPCPMSFPARGVGDTLQIPPITAQGDSTIPVGSNCSELPGSVTEECPSPNINRPHAKEGLFQAQPQMGRWSRISPLAEDGILPRADIFCIEDTGS